MLEKVESNMEEVDLEVVKNMCNEVIKARQDFDNNLVTLSKTINDYLKCRYLHGKQNNPTDYETFLHVNEVELQEDCIVIQGIAVETVELEPSIWACKVFIGFDELTEKWELSSLKEFHEGWMRALNLMYKFLPKGFPNLCQITKLEV